MAKPDKERQSPADKKQSPPVAGAWGTWEELLLAYAVNRFGTNSWDSVSSELRKRSSAQVSLTPYHCKQKYEELERRFAKSDRDDVDTAAVPWIEELRELRVAELQRQLENFDIYISSLQSKVKKLTEESEKNGCGETKKKPDLGQKNEEEVKYHTPNPVISGEEQIPAGEESDRDNQSVNGSNGNLETGAEKSENENENESGPVAKEPVDDSSNGGPVAEEPVKSEPDVGASEPPGSKSDGTSDVQSSASKSRKERSDTVGRGCSKADELENEDQLKDSIPVRSLPLVDILQKVRELGSAIFERRLDRQEKLRYKNLIKQHIHFETLQTRLKEGRYSDGNNNFFRDLLLLVTNTRIFFPNKSIQFIAATKLQQFIQNEMTTKRKQKPDSKSTIQKTSSKPTTTETKSDAPMIVCQKRSSITTKSSGTDKKKEETDVKNNNNNNNKQSATKFLNRMKQSSLEVVAHGDSEKSSVGRPTKRAAVLGKRNWECVESETSELKQTKKRSKR